MSSIDDDDDLTDIRQLPDLDEEMEDNFESLDDIAESLGMHRSGEDEEDEEPLSLDSIAELPETPPDFNFAEEDQEEINLNDVPDFPSDDTSFEPEEDEEEEDFDFESESLDSENDESEGFNFDADEDKGDNSSPDFNDSKSEQEFELESELELESNSEAVSDVDYLPRTEFTLEEELSPVPIESTHQTKTPISPAIEKSTPHSTPPEDFEEVKNFAKNMSSQNFSSEGNPPFSIILKGIKYIEDAESIADILVKFKISNDGQQDSVIKDLSKGTFLIPRLSEYAAIILCHQLRSFDLEILMGLTEEITPPKSYTSNDRGATSKRTIYANRKHNIDLKGTNQFSDILTTTLSQLHDCNIIKYIGVASESKMIEADMLKNSDQLEREILEQVSEKSQEELKLLQLKKENLNAADSKFDFNFNEIYQSDSTGQKKSGLEYIYADLITQMKQQAKSANANAIMGINFSISPIAIEEYLTQGPKYQILCTGNMVWIEKK